jgi:RND family efflux transporter MFP subunit
MADLEIRCASEGCPVVEKSELLHQLRIDRSETVAARGPRTAAVVFAAVLVLAALAGGGWWLLRGASATDVTVATAVAPSAGAGPAAVLQATGYVTARREATVSAQITGTLTEVLIEEGEHVDKGQVLALLDDTAQKAALAQAQAQANAATAQLKQVSAQLAQSRRDLGRAEDLVGRKLVSTQAVEVARTQVTTQSAQVEAQRRQIDLARATVEGARVQLDYCTVRAPFAGVVIAKSAQVGEIVSPFSAGGGFTRTGIGTIVDMDSLEVEVDVNESYINRVTAKQPVEAVLDAYPDWTIPGHVIAIIPTADRGKATVKVRVAFEQKDARMVPDMGVRVSFLEHADSAAAQPAVAPKGVLVPKAAIVQRDGKSALFVIEGDRARLRPVTGGREYGDQRLVEGIESGLRVVAQPPAGLADGARVKIETAK